MKIAAAASLSLIASASAFAPAPAASVSYLGDFREMDPVLECTDRENL
jgi:hypothetical protein